MLAPALRPLSCALVANYITSSGGGEPLVTALCQIFKGVGRAHPGELSCPSIAVLLTTVMIGWPRPYQRPISTKKEAEPFIRQLYPELPWARTPRQRDGASRLCGRLRQGQTTERRARSCPHQPQSDWMQAGTVSGLRICWSSSDMKSGSEMPPRFVPVVCIF